MFYFRWTPGVVAYLIFDALYLGLMATALCMSFFPKGLARIGLLTLLFPLFSLALCAWMNVFGFYLRLDDRDQRVRKRKEAQKALEKGMQQYWSNPEKVDNGVEFVNLAFEEDITNPEWLIMIVKYPSALMTSEIMPEDHGEVAQPQAELEVVPSLEGRGEGHPDWGRSGELVWVPVAKESWDLQTRMWACPRRDHRGRADLNKTLVCYLRESRLPTWQIDLF